MNLTTKQRHALETIRTLGGRVLEVRLRKVFGYRVTTLEALARKGYVYYQAGDGSGPVVVLTEESFSCPIDPSKFKA